MVANIVYLLELSLNSTVNGYKDGLYEYIEFINILFIEEREIVLQIRLYYLEERELVGF